MVELVRAQSAVALRPSYSTTIYRTRSVPDLSLYSRYIPKWPYRYYKDWDLYDDYWYDRYYYYSPLYRSTFFPRRYYYNNHILNPYSYWNYPYSYWTRYRGYLYTYPSYYSRYYYYYDDYPRYRYAYFYPYRYGYYSPFDRYSLSSNYWDRRFRDWCQEYLWPRIQSPPYLKFLSNFYTIWGRRPVNFHGMASTSFSLKI